MPTFLGKTLTFFQKTLTTDILNDDPDYLVYVSFSHDDDDQTLGNFSVGIANGHSGSIITPYLGIDAIVLLNIKALH